MNDFRTQLIRSEDKFRFVLELECLYRSAKEYQAGISFLEDYAEHYASWADKLNIKLAVTFMKRSRSSEPPATLLKAVDQVANEAIGHDELEIKTAVVRGAINVVRSPDQIESHNVVKRLYVNLNNTGDQFIFGITAWFFGISCMLKADYKQSEEAFHDSLSIFRRFSHKVLYAFALTDYAVLKKCVCRYEEASRLLRQALRLFQQMGLHRGQVATYVNFGNVCKRSGDWKAARYYFEAAESLLPKMLNSDEHDASYLSRVCWTVSEHLMVMQRHYDSAERRLTALLAKYCGQDSQNRLGILINEYLGELYMEMGDYDKAAIYLESSIKSCGHALAESDVSTEVRRRRAELNLNRGDYELSKSQALECLRLCKRVNDKYELGAALRVLGNVYAQYGDRKAVPCYESAISTLRNIHECYELMKTCLDYGRFLVNNDKADGEVYLLEARQLCKKLELEFFIAKVEVELSKLEMNRNRLSEAHERLAVAKVVCDRLQKCDKRQIAPLIDHARGKLNRRIFEESMTGAKEIRSICRLYEDARFPMNGMKPDIAYQVAQTVNAESLFLIKRCGRGYSVPVSYNISINEAKEIVRRLDRDNEKPVLGIDKNPRVFTLHSGCVLVCVPTTSGTGYVLCTCISGEPKISSRLFEFLLASAEAIERVADGDYESPDFMEDDFIIANGKDMLSHPRGEFKDIVTVTPNMIKLICLAKRASRSDETILIEGETGVGKELFAKAIHASSKRSTKPFVTINAGGLPVSLLESQLFGHIKGAFTDAVSDRTGLIEEAAHGIVFLDEVGEMGPELQVKLLRLLENGEYRRLGDNTLRFAKVRVISATNRDLLRDVDNGRFRRDLYYRLATVRLHIPPLRFRRRDIEVLIRQFLTDRARRNGQSDRYYGVDVKAMEALEFYNWPGNVRELQNEIRRIVSLIGENEIIRFGMISPHIREYLKSKNRSESLLGRSVERFERRLILEALNNNDWNRLRTAEELGIPRTTLLAKMRRLNVATRQSNQNVDAL